MATTVPGKPLRKSSSQATLSASRWLVGSSNNKRSGRLRSNLHRATRLLSPPIRLETPREQIKTKIRVRTKIRPSVVRSPIAHKNTRVSNHFRARSYSAMTRRFHSLTCRLPWYRCSGKLSPDKLFTKASPDGHRSASIARSRTRSSSQPFTASIAFCSRSISLVSRSMSAPSDERSLET